MDHEKFDWDSGNLDHLTDAEPEQAEEAILDPDAVYFSTYNRGAEQRKAPVGQADDGLLLYVVYTHRGGKVRVITVRFPDPAEQRRYRRRGK
jgi:uncharacterized DUF497 family protein